MINDKKPVGFEEQSQNLLEKEYDITLKCGSKVKFNFSVTTDGYNPEDFGRLLQKMAEKTHSFYLHLGIWLNNMP